MLFLASSALLFAVVIGHRIIVTARERRQESFFQTWRQTIIDNLFQMPETLSAVAAEDTISFMLLWNNLQDTLQGEPKEQLNVLARALEIDKRAVRLLGSRSMSLRLLAISTLGHLKHHASWRQLEKDVWSRSMTLAIHALHALSRIDANRAVEMIVSFLIQTEDWPEYRIANILYEMGPSSFSKALGEAVLTVQPEKQVRLLNMMRYADRAVALPLARQLLQNSSSEDVLAACLHLLELFGDSRELAVVKRMLKHNSPVVRIRAVSALGQMAGEEDIKDLEECLRDQTWWVRYRAALAIAGLPGINRERIERMRNAQADRFAVDILSYVLSQQGG